MIDPYMIQTQVRAAIRIPVNVNAVSEVLSSDRLDEYGLESEDEQFLEWEVQFGDTLSDIAHRFGLNVDEVRLWLSKVIECT